MATLKVNATDGKVHLNESLATDMTNAPTAASVSTSPPLPVKNTSNNTPQSTPTPDMAPTSPCYPPYGAAFIDPSQLAASGYDLSDPSAVNLTYVYPMSPQFPVQYYPDFSNGYQSYPGSPSLHPQSPPMNPTSPNFSPTFQYQQGGITLSPSTHAYMLPPHSGQPFPPLHISSPVMPANSIPGSPPLQYVSGHYIISATSTSSGGGNGDNRKHQHHNKRQYNNNNHHNNNHNNHNNNQHYHHHHQQQHQQHQQQQHQHQQQHHQHQYQHQQHQQHQQAAEAAAAAAHLHQQQQQQLDQQLEAELNSYHTHNIYVRGLSSSTTDESFLEMCLAYGSVASSKAILDQKSGECKGYGFAMFENENECENAIEGLNKAGLQASFARVGQESFSSRLRHLQDETSTNIYISNLPLDTSEQKLEELFRPYETISNRILRDPVSGLSRGVGFARLIDREAASAIIERFNDQTIEGSSAPLQVRFADSPAQKKLKNQTTRRRVVRAIDFQQMSSFSVRPMMPSTPETMLGFAPASASSNNQVQHFTCCTDHRFTQQPSHQISYHLVPARTVSTNNTNNNNNHHYQSTNKEGGPSPEEELIEGIEKKMNISEVKESS